MTSPAQDGAFAPASRNRSRFTAVPAVAPSVGDYADAEVARGQSDAIFGALARLQLKVDVLTREHSDALARVEALLQQLDNKLDRLAQPQP